MFPRIYAYNFSFLPLSPAFLPGRIPSPARRETFLPGRILSPTRRETFLPGRIPSPARREAFLPGRIPSPARRETFLPGRTLFPASREDLFQKRCAYLLISSIICPTFASKYHKTVPIRNGTIHYKRFYADQRASTGIIS